jgi:hypothetical protein
MITFMTTFKPFVGDDETRQRNALLSWLSLGQDIEVFVFGVPPAPDDLNDQFNIKNYPLVDWNNTGMPKVDEMFKIAQCDSKNVYLAYVNGDIVLGADFVKSLCIPKWKRFLLVGQRWDTGYLAPIEDASFEAVKCYRDTAKRQGSLRGPTGLDFFAFPKDTFSKAPPLVPGGVVWDGYMIYYAESQGIPVIDATNDILAIHQNHPYKLVSRNDRDLDAGPAAQNNFAVASMDNPTYIHTPYTTENAGYFLKNGRLRSTSISIPYLKHRIKQILIHIARRTGTYQLIKSKT